MTKKDKKKMLTKIIKTYKTTTKQMRKIEDALNMNCENVISSLVYDLLEKYVDLTGYVLGDAFETLSWYIWENDCGKNQLEAGMDGNLKPIKNVSDLLWLIELQKGDCDESS